MLEDFIRPLCDYLVTMDEEESTMLRPETLQCPLESAAESRNLYAVEVFIAFGAAVSGYRGVNGRTLFDAAAAGGSAEIVYALLRTAAYHDLNETPAGTSALWTAASLGHGEAAFALVSGGADATHPGVLFEAVRSGLESLVRLVLACEADPNQSGEGGKTPLHLAASRGSDAMTKALLAHGADKDATDSVQETPLMKASRTGKPEAAELLLTAGASVNVRNSSGESALHLAAQNGCATTVIVLVDDGADKDARDEGGETPLMGAIRCYNFEVAGWLMTMGADVNLRDGSGMSALHIAAQNGCSALVLTLVEQGADGNALDGMGETPLMKAVHHNHFEAVSWLLAHEVKVNVLNESGVSALQIAAATGCEVIVTALLDDEADTNVIDNNGTSPVLAAISAGHTQVVESLLDCGAKVYLEGSWFQVMIDHVIERKDVAAAKAILGSDGYYSAVFKVTPLHSAAFLNHPAAIDLLVVDGGMDVDVRGGNGHTALGLATAFGHTDAMRTLLAHGSSPTITGMCCLEMACSTQRRGFSAGVELLLRAGADEAFVSNDGMTLPQMLEAGWGSREEKEKVLRMFDRAPKDRAWRRRGWIAMVRARGGVAVCTTGDEELGGGVGGLIVELIGLEIEGLFRHVVGFV